MALEVQLAAKAEELEGVKTSGKRHSDELAARAEAAEAAAKAAKADADAVTSSHLSATAALEAKITKLQSENMELDGAVDAAREALASLEAHSAENARNAAAMLEREQGKVVEHMKSKWEAKVTAAEERASDAERMAAVTFASHFDFMCSTTFSCSLSSMAAAFRAFSAECS